MKRKSLVFSMMLVLVFAMVLSACGGNNSNSGKNTNTPAAGENNGAEGTGKNVKITFMNSKAEIQKQIEDAAKAFTAANPNISIEILTTASGQSPQERASVLYASGSPATMSMLDTSGVEMFKDKAADLSGEKWVAELAQENTLDGKTIAFPFAVEGYGLLYNKAVVDKAVGGTFDPTTINTLSSLEELFKKIEASGTAPIIIGSMDWSLGAHFLPIAYATQPGGDVAKFVASMKAGEVNLADNAQFNGLMDTFDLMKNYNKGKKDPIAVAYDQTSAAVAKGEAAMTFNGNWMFADLEKAQAGGEYGFIPVPISNDASEKANSALAIGATKQIIIDKTVNTQEQQDAAKKFLDWIVYDQAGQEFLVTKANIIPAFKNFTIEPNDSLARAIKDFNNAGKSIPFAGNFIPGSHFKDVGASMQKYLANKNDRAAVAADAITYWKNEK